MDRPLHKTAAFSLTEVLVAATLSGLVMAMILTLLIKNLGFWREGVARLRLSESSRNVRETILHGINGTAGLRPARRSRLTWTSDSINLQDVASSNWLTLLWVSNRPPVWVDQAGTHPLSRYGVFVDRIAIGATGNMLSIHLTLALTNGNQKLAQTQEIRVYLLNE